MPKKQLTRSDLKLRFYALMYGCSTPMDIIAAVDFIEESYNLDEGAKEYLASVLERANTMKVPTGAGKLSSIQQPSDDELWRVYKKFWQDYAENWNRALHTGEVLVINGVKNREDKTLKKLYELQDKLWEDSFEFEREDLFDQIRKNNAANRRYNK